MTDGELGQYITRYGDRLALKAFCRQRAVTNENRAGMETVRSALLWNLRHRLEERENSAITNRERGAGNRFAVKVTRRVEMGWLNFERGTYHQIRARNGGGTRHLSVQKSTTMGELLQTGKDLFFPNGHSPKGPVEDFEFDIRDYSHNVVSPEVTVAQLHEESKLRMLRVYTCSKAKHLVLISDESSDSEPRNERLKKVIFCFSFNFYFDTFVISFVYCKLVCRPTSDLK